MKRAALVTHGRPDAIGDTIAQLRTLAESAGVELLYSAEEAAKHGLEPSANEVGDADLCVVLGGDGTMLRALTLFLGTPVPVIGVNFGRVGFLASIPPKELEPGVARALAGEYAVHELPTLEAEWGGARRVAVNDVVTHSAVLGRMVEIAWQVDGEDFGTLACDGVICSTPSGSTAYNLSNGGPVLAWGIDAMAITFIAPHSLQARPLVVPRGAEAVVTNRSASLDAAIIVDGQRVTELSPADEVRVRLGEAKSLLATLPETRFYRRFRDTFTV